MDLIKKIGAVVFALALFVVLASIVKTTAKAASNDVNPNVRVLVSTDEGRTWTADACVPSDGTVQFRTRVWNTGSDDIGTVYGSTDVTNNGYLRDCTQTNNNEDGDNYGYNPGFFTGEEARIHNVAANGSETTAYQGTITTCRVVGPCDEVIRGEVMLPRIDTSTGDGLRDVNFLGRALAAIVYPNTNDEVTVRIAGGTCPRTCGSSTTTKLPQTGNSIIELVNSLTQI